MRKYLFIFLLIPICGMAQFQDNFSDGDFISDPRWYGDSNHFEINQAGQLHLKSSGTDTAVLFTRNNLLQQTEWSWWMKLSFNTSANNYARVYLIADTNHIMKITSAVYLQAGGSDDSVIIVKQSGAEHRKLFSLKDYKTNHSTHELRFKILSDTLDSYEVLVDTNGQFSFTSCGSFRNETIRKTKWFGVFCKYTSSNATRFYFDDFYVGKVRYDSVAPMIIKKESDPHEGIILCFSEPLESNTALNPANYLLMNLIKHPDTVKFVENDPSKVSLRFVPGIPDGSCDTLSVSGIGDLWTNTIKDTALMICNYRPKTYDIVINEILADPDPPVGLPSGEFIELYNTTPFTVNLEGWLIQCGNTRKNFPPVEMEPNGYLIVARDSMFRKYGNCVLLFTASATLSNEGSLIVIKDKDQRIIHAVEWDPSWYGDSFKKEGGWSIEMADPANPCGCLGNWFPSINEAGGSPGKLNSVSESLPDDSNPFPISALLTDSNIVELSMSESIDSLSIAKSRIIVQPGNLSAETIFGVQPLYQTLRMNFPVTFDSGVVYSLYLHGSLSDCAGNIVDTGSVVRFAIPVRPCPNDIIINEILHDPVSEGHRFIELLSNSEKVLDLQTIIISGSDTIAGQLPDARTINEMGYLLFPGEYYVVTDDRENILNQYHCPSPLMIHEREGLSGFGNDSGIVVIARHDDLTVIDRVRYHKKMHLPFLASTDGVSLERYDPLRSSDLWSNWHSAAETVGFATPGYLNSHVSMAGDFNTGLQLSPRMFSPDNDGYQDILDVCVSGLNPGFLISAAVYDARGRLVKQLLNNVYGENNTCFIWDGSTGSNAKAPVGTYLIQAELTWPDGTRKKLKSTCVLAARF